MDRIFLETKILAGDEGVITAKAWAFGAADRVGDVIEPGAFKSAKLPLPMLFGHDLNDPIGTWDVASEKSDEDFDANDFSGQSWKQIKGTTNLGQIGDTAQLITSDQINVARTRKGKGTYNAGTMELVCDLDGSDEGQAALIVAGKSPDNFAFKIEFNDAPSGGTPTTRLFIALVMGTPEVYEEANSVKKLNATLEINSNIVRVAAAPGEG